MDTRRDFIKKAALLAAGGGMVGGFPASIHKALAIDPAAGSTYLDAEHIVILMQENRSFDHTYGTLRGVRGFNDPRAVALPNGNPVWLQSNSAGETYAPFRLNIKDTKSTWMSSLPHSWSDQQDARNGGKHDGWLEAKRSGQAAYGHLPLTLGFYNREDLPFYYALADAFTVCDQNFCSSLTGTTPNRLHLWTGTIRAEASTRAKANVWNENVDYGSEASWTTFPERLEDLGVSWRIYQNEISLSTGLHGEAAAWLANFTDNPLEWFTQYNVRFSPAHRRHLLERQQTLPAELAALEAQPQPWSPAHRKKVQARRKERDEMTRDLPVWTEAAFAKLSPREQNLHRKAFSTNEGDPDYRSLTTLAYRAGGAERQMEVPKGDVLHQFRQDVRAGKLPTVSWIVSPENFSDHPGAPWYGAWYLSEVLDILTQDADLWRKTIFIICYDENDGYFDHVPPFVPSHPDRPETGGCSAGIETSVEHVAATERDGTAPGPIGLGFRVPLLVVSPWSRGGYVCSQVFDHTSMLQFLEKVLSHKLGRPVRETNINSWRRAVCGDLTSVFRPYNGEKIALPESVEWKAFAGSIHQAQFKAIPNGFKKFTPEEVAEARAKPRSSQLLPRQEKGGRPACALPYELAVDGALNKDRKAFVIRFAAGKDLFGERSVGAPFHVYAPGKVRAAGKNADAFEAGRNWAYTVLAGDGLSGEWQLADFADELYHLRVHGPNGFFREFLGGSTAPLLEVTLSAVRVDKVLTGDALLRLVNHEPRPLTIVINDFAYGTGQRTLELSPAGAKDAAASVSLALNQSFGWYDLGIRTLQTPGYEQRYAGHVETGKESMSDPQMAG